ncbi:hypothetical protein DPMN_134795 [Dreissena polymorpha]|uniref:Uncharacterized protein n=2 Tax=Dreissena polymorpha TaxID=45954 RepID=A0A9D4G0R5_DREPO|nr:hypothetical protein DPMN_134795 [Dreissena polymorpha]
MNPVILIGRESKSGGSFDSDTERNSIVKAKSLIQTTYYGSMNNATEGSACLGNLNDAVTAHEMASINSANMKAEKFGFGAPKMNANVITNQPSKSVENAAFDRGLYRDYTTKGPRVEFFVWPVLYLHVGGPLLAKGIAQGTKWGIKTDASSMWSWRILVPEANVSVTNVNIRVAEERSTGDIGARLSAVGNIEARLLDASSSDIETRLTLTNAPFNVESRGSEAVMSKGEIEDRLRDATSSAETMDSQVPDAHCPMEDSVSRISEARVGDNEDDVEQTNDLCGTIKTQASDSDEQPVDNEDMSTNF